MEYLQQLQNKILVKSIERLQIMGFKYKKIILEDKERQQSSKKNKVK